MMFPFSRNATEPTPNAVAGVTVAVSVVGFPAVGVATGGSMVTVAVPGSMWWPWCWVDAAANQKSASTVTTITRSPTARGKKSAVAWPLASKDVTTVLSLTTRMRTSPDGMCPSTASTSAKTRTRSPNTVGLDSVVMAIA